VAWRLAQGIADRKKGSVEQELLLPQRTIEQVCIDDDDKIVSAFIQHRDALARSFSGVCGLDTLPSRSEHLSGDLG
jgi:hypothetical protein